MIFEADREIHPLQLKNSLKIISFLVLLRWHLYMTIKSQWKEYFAGPLIIDTWCWLLLVYVFPTVPSCLSWELLGYLVPCTLGRSYLSDRSQLVVVYGVTSYPVPVFHWPLIRGPLFFLIYVNDLCLSNFTTNSSLVLYVDDTTLYTRQGDINTIHNFFSSNQLAANAAKTKSMVISTKKDPFPDMILHLKNQPIERVSSVNFLGMDRTFHSDPISTRCILYLAQILEYQSTTCHLLNKNPYQPPWIMSKPSHKDFFLSLTFL